MQKLIISLICCLLPALTFADTLAIRDDAPDHYVVVKGDTLWDISAKFFKDPWKWPEIWGLNKDAIKNPHWIYPGDVVRLDHDTLKVEHPPTPAQPGGEEVVVKPPVEPGTHEVIPPPPPQPGKENVAVTETDKGIRLRPRARVEAGEHDAIPGIPVNDITPFLDKPLVVETDELSTAPVIVSSLERMLLSDSDIAYVKNLPKDQGLVWQIYRPGKALVDPVSKEVLGYEAVYLGNARVEKFDEISTLRIFDARSEIYPGDRLMQAPNAFPDAFIPRAPDMQINARVMGIVDGISMTAENAIIILNQGRHEGVQNGHVLALYRKGKTVRGRAFDTNDMVMPNQRYGLVFVFRTFEHVSYGLVMHSDIPVEMLDVAQTP